MKNLVTIRQFADKHPAFSQGSLRKLIYNSKVNGCAIAVQRLGRRILIDEQAFLTWILTQSQGVLS